MTSATVKARLLVSGPERAPVRHAVVHVLDTEIRTVATTVATTGIPRAVALPGPGTYLAQARLTTGAVLRQAFRTGDPGDCVLLDATAGEEPPTGPPGPGPANALLSWWGLADGRWAPIDGTAVLYGDSADAFARPTDGDSVLALQVEPPGRPARTTLLPPHAHAVIRTTPNGDWRVELPETLPLALLTFLDAGDVRSARELAASRLRTGVPPAAPLLEALALAHLRLRTETHPDPAPLRELRARWPRSSDAALLSGWYAGAVTGDRATARAELSAALELGPPVLRLGLRMLYDGLHLLGLGTEPRTDLLRELLQRGGAGPLTTFTGPAARALWPAPTAAGTAPRPTRPASSPGGAPLPEGTTRAAWRADLAQCLTLLNRTGLLDAEHHSAEAGEVSTLSWLDPGDDGTTTLTVAATPAPSGDRTHGAAPTLSLAVTSQDHRLATMDGHGRAVFHRVPAVRWLSLTVLPPAPDPQGTPLPALASLALSAHGRTDILQQITGPDGEVELTVSATGRPGRYIVDLTLHTTTGAPRIVALGYRTLLGEHRHLLVACRYRALTKGATASALCTDVDPRVGWTLRPSAAASELSSWSTQVIGDSVASAANRISREAWAATAARCGHAPIRHLIDGLLTT
ncbi:hypothetical protein [Streptomyces cyaneofuscatus]|uniref:hypothetical protein n=1 Tax=Streptomyces cyaneofuscatus TaxID=66883 RepID=UPI003809482B